jgi:hypothetical protein
MIIVVVCALLSGAERCRGMSKKDDRAARTLCL